MDAIRVVVGGSQGRMSRCLSETIQQDPTLSLIAQTDRYQGGLAAITAPFDIFIDFTHPTAVEDHLALCCERQRRMVIGVTGLSEAQKERIKQASKKIPIVFSPNMSLGINLSFKLLEMAAQTLNHELEGIAIQEIHHKYKQDIPSGTALKMGEIIANARGKPLEKSDISFASSRVAEVMGEHTVLFALMGEQLEIKHKTEDRTIFARGAICASKWLMHQPPGLYDMQDVLGLRFKTKDSRLC